MRDPSVSEAVDQPQLSIFATNHYAMTSCTLTPLLHREYFRPNLIKRLQHSCNRPRRPEHLSDYGSMLHTCNEGLGETEVMDTIDSVGLGGQPLDDKVEEEIPRL